MTDTSPLDNSDLGEYSEKALDFFVSHPLKLTENFMKKIYADDQFYRQARYALVANAKNLYLYGSAREVRKACISLIENQDFVKDPEKKEEQGSSNEKIDTLTREIIEAVYDQQNLWIRKLIENLVNLINFQNTNINEAYRIFLSAENMNLFLGKQLDFRDFYAFASGNVDSTIQGFSERIQSDLKTLGQKNIWFLDEQKLKKRRPPIFASILSRYKAALPLASDDEKTVLGATYHRFFSRASLSAHASIGSLPYEISLESIKANIAHISILSQHCMSRANTLMGFEEPQSIEQITGKDSIAPKLMAKYRAKFEVADLILAYGDLAEILEIKESPFGYTSYKVRYLARPPLPELPEDWMPADEIIRIANRATIREFWKRNLENLSNVEEAKLLLGQSDAILYEKLKRVLVDLAQRGVLIPVLFEPRKKKT